jgi:hypothetical protein
METIAFSASSTSLGRTILFSSALSSGHDDNELVASLRSRTVRSAIFLVYEADALVSAFFSDSEDNTPRFLSRWPHLQHPAPSETASSSFSTIITLLPHTPNRIFTSS